MPEEDILLTPSQVGRMVRANPKTISVWAREGKLTAVWKGSQRRFYLSEVRRAIKAGDIRDRGDGIIPPTARKEPTPPHRKDATIWYLRLMEILSDGEWHYYEDLVKECAPLVPPGQAWRAAEKNRVKYYVRAGKPVEPRHYGDRNNTILSGQRSVIQGTLVTIRKMRASETEYATIPNSKRQKPTRIRLI